MNKILIEVSTGELLDKISILEIKKEKISDSALLEIINLEYSILKNESDKKVKKDQKIDELYKKLKKTNEKLWIIEDDKRLCEKNSDFGEKFIELSRNVHFLNDERAKIKLEINNYSKSTIKEVKKYTDY
tara:strand:- start:513 stop:902 length:390 start_codon:yes stop_codon:yes gene_type:complete